MNQQQYDRSLTPTKNIGLPDSLLSRFDLLFIVLDQMDPEIDRQIAQHVSHMHRYCTDDGGEILFNIAWLSYLLSCHLVWATYI